MTQTHILSIMKELTTSHKIFVLVALNAWLIIIIIFATYPLLDYILHRKHI